MTICEFLTKHARNKYTTINDLWKCAKGPDTFLRTGEGKQEFLDLLGRFLDKYRKTGTMPNGLVFWCELVFRKNQGSVRLGDRNIGLIKVGRPLPQES